MPPKRKVKIIEREVVDEDNESLEGDVKHYNEADVETAIQQVETKEKEVDVVEINKRLRLKNANATRLKKLKEESINKAVQEKLKEKARKDQELQQRKAMFESEVMRIVNKNKVEQPKPVRVAKVKAPPTQEPEEESQEQQFYNNNKNLYM